MRHSFSIIFCLIQFTMKYLNSFSFLLVLIKSWIMDVAGIAGLITLLVWNDRIWIKWPQKSVYSCLMLSPNSVQILVLSCFGNAMNRWSEMNKQYWLPWLYVVRYGKNRQNWAEVKISFLAYNERLQNYLSNSIKCFISMGHLFLMIRLFILHIYVDIWKNNWWKTS